MTDEFNSDSLLELYLYESSSLLDALDGILLDAEASGSLSKEDIHEIFRIMHTIKGSSSMMAYSGISEVSHKTEDLFDVIRNSGVNKDFFNELFDVVLAVSDFLKTEVNKVQEGGELETETGPLTSVILSLTEKLRGPEPEGPALDLGRVLGAPPAFMSAHEPYSQTGPMPAPPVSGSVPEPARIRQELHTNPEMYMPEAPEGGRILGVEPPLQSAGRPLSIDSSDNQYELVADISKITARAAAGQAEPTGRDTWFLHIHFNEGSKMENIRAFMLINKLNEKGAVNRSIPASPETDTDAANTIVENGFYVSYTTSLFREQIETLIKGTLSVESVSFVRRMPDDPNTFDSASESRPPGPRPKPVAQPQDEPQTIELFAVQGPATPQTIDLSAGQEPSAPFRVDQSNAGIQPGGQAQPGQFRFGQSATTEPIEPVGQPQPTSWQQPTPFRFGKPPEATEPAGQPHGQPQTATAPTDRPQPAGQPTGQPQPTMQPIEQPQPSVQQPDKSQPTQPQTSPFRFGQPLISQPANQRTPQTATTPGQPQPTVQPGQPQTATAQTGQPATQPTTQNPLATPPSGQPRHDTFRFGQPLISQPANQRTPQTATTPGQPQPTVQSGQPQPATAQTGQPATQPTTQPPLATQPSGQPRHDTFRFGQPQEPGQPSAKPQTATAPGQPQPSLQPGQPQPATAQTGQPATQPTTQPPLATPPSGQPRHDTFRFDQPQEQTQPTGQQPSQPQTATTPTGQPTIQPTPQPQPATQPSSQPRPDTFRFGQPQEQTQPTGQPSGQPQTATAPSGQPTTQPSGQPRPDTFRFGQPQEQTQPTGQPSSQPQTATAPTGQPQTATAPTSQPQPRPQTAPFSFGQPKPTAQPTAPAMPQAGQFRFGQPLPDKQTPGGQSQAQPASFAGTAGLYPAHPEPQQTAPATPQTTQPWPTQPQTTQPWPTQTQSAQPQSAQPRPMQSQTTQPRPMQPQTALPQSTPFRFDRPPAETQPAGLPGPTTAPMTLATPPAAQTATPPLPAQATDYPEPANINTDQTELRGELPPSAHHASQNIISVELKKLDALLDLVGEIVINESIVTENPDLAGLELANFRKASRQLDKLTGELQDTVMDIRMLPISVVFQRMRRIVRDMGKSLGKEVNLMLVGDTTEVDKTILDALSDPIMHLVRNAMDHAIETPTERANAGKSPTGHLILSAQNSGGDIIISVSDDGKGLDKTQILNRARANCLLRKPENEYSDKEIFNLLMTPGFSTSEQVSEYSGRGVGLDVVKSNIEKVGGSIIIESKKGLGTNIILKIPLTLAIISCIEIAIGKDIYSIPINNIRESFKSTAGQLITDPLGGEMIMLRGKAWPIVRLYDLFGVPGAVTDIADGILVLVDAGDHSVCLLADSLVGKFQVVVKPLPLYLSRFNKKRSGISGCTIMGNGNISLIVNVQEIVE